MDAASETGAFAMALPVKPVSSQASPKHTRWYRQALIDGANEAGPRHQGGALYARVIWFQLRQERNEPDVDNILKRVLDALKGLAYEDERQIVRCQAVKATADVNGEFILSTAEMSSSSIVKRLQEMLGTVPDVLYVEVGPVTDTTVSLGHVR